MLDLIQNREYKMVINEEEVVIKVCHHIKGESEEQMLYYCEISRYWDNFPHKTIAIE